MCMVTYLRIESSLVETRAHLQNEVTYLADVLEVQIFNGSSDFVSLSSLRLPNLTPLSFSVALVSACCMIVTVPVSFSTQRGGQYGVVQLIHGVF